MYTLCRVSSQYQTYTNDCLKELMQAQGYLERWVLDQKEQISISLTLKSIANNFIWKFVLKKQQKL